MTNKPQLAFVGRLAGIVLCACGTEMKDTTNYYRCPNPKCQHHGKKFVAAISNAVLFYEVKKT